MLTASNRTTRKSQEVLATNNGELVTFPGDAKVQALTDTATINGPVRFLGLIIMTSTESGQMNITSDGNLIFTWKTGGAGNVSGGFLPSPIYCPNGISCLKQYGSSATFLVYYYE